MTDLEKQLEDAATDYWLMIPSDNDNRFGIDDIVDGFKAGAKFERERSKKTIKKAIGALKYAYEDHSDQFYLNVIEELKKDYEGVE